MKIAVPTTQENNVDAHFGHCEFYTVYTANNGVIESSETVASPQGCGCKSNIASVLKTKGVSVMLAGNMGNGALNVLHNHGIEVFRGNSGNVRQLAEAFLQGKIGDSGLGCDHHEEGHECSH